MNAFKIQLQPSRCQCRRFQSGLRGPVQQQINICFKCLSDYGPTHRSNLERHCVSGVQMQNTKYKAAAGPVQAQGRAGRLPLGILYLFLRSWICVEYILDIFGYMWVGISVGVEWSLVVQHIESKQTILICLIFRLWVATSNFSKFQEK